MNNKEDFQENSDLSRPETSGEKKESWQSFFGEVFKFALLALLIVVPIRTFIAQPYIVNGSSMSPTFENGDYLIVDQLSYRFEEPARGDVVVFRYPQDPSKFYIKRIVGLPEETLEIVNGAVTIKDEEHPEGFIIDETYKQEPFNATMTKILGEKEYFVMGDNRSNSSDSRSWGPLPEDLIVGRSLIRLFPLNKASIFPGN